MVRQRMGVLWQRMFDAKYSMGHLLWLKVYELSRLLSCCKRACIIPALLRDTGRV